MRDATAITTVPAIAPPTSAAPAAVFWCAALATERGHRLEVPIEVMCVLRFIVRDFLTLAKARGWDGQRRLQRALYTDRRTPPRVAEEVAALITPAEFALLLERHSRVAAYFEQPSASTFAAMQASPTHTASASTPGGAGMTGQARQCSAGRPAEISHGQDRKTVFRDRA